MVLSGPVLNYKEYYSVFVIYFLALLISVAIVYGQYNLLTRD